MSPTLRQFAAFVQVARLGSFARASESLGLSQPALSQTIAQMEGLLGARLFHRTTRAVRLSAEGELLLPRAAAILDSVEEAVTVVRGLAERDRGRISLGALPSVAAVFLPEILRLFRQQRPATRVAVTDGISEALYAGVEAGQIDLAICSRLRGHAAVTFLPVLRERFALVMPRAHPLARRPTVTWAEALRHDFIAFPPGSGGHAAIGEALQRVGLALNPVMTFAQSSTVLNIVASGAGVTALPALGCPKPAEKRLVVRPLTDPVVDREVGVVRPAARESSAATRALMDIAIGCMVGSGLPGLVAQADPPGSASPV